MSEIIRESELPGPDLPEFLRLAEEVDTGRRAPPQVRAARRLGPDDYGRPADQRGGTRLVVQNPVGWSEDAVSLQAVAAAVALDPLGDIAARTRSLTYGEMICYATEVVATEGYVAPTTGEGLAAILHRWATRRAE